MHGQDRAQRSGRRTPGRAREGQQVEVETDGGLLHAAAPDAAWEACRADVPRAAASSVNRAIASDTGAAAEVPAAGVLAAVTIF